MYAIVDIETTGAYAAANGITEISIQVFDGEKVVERFDSLVNPVHTIPPYIQAMTGITNEMVSTAPLFEDIAEKVYHLLKDNIFVAHNVSFDFSFVKSQLFFAGYEFDAKKLCTVRLARKVLPGYPSYSLGRICTSLGISHTNQHRAGGDTDATVALFREILANDTDGFVQKSLGKASKEYVLPANVAKEDFDALPYTSGVYYFHDAKGKVIYVGKAKNLKYRVNSHFANNSTGRQKQNFARHIYHISFETCGTELIAAVKESAEIKKLWPQYNSAQKRREDVYGIIDFLDQNGYLRLGIDRISKQSKPLYTFHHIENGRAMLRKLVSDFELCDRMCFVETTLSKQQVHTDLCKGACVKEEDVAAYNQRVERAISVLNNQPSFAILDKGIERNEKSCILVVNGKFYGLGYLPDDYKIYDVAQLKDRMKPLPENSYITNLLFDYAKRYPQKVMYFSNTLIPHF